MITYNLYKVICSLNVIVLPIRLRIGSGGTWIRQEILLNQDHQIGLVFVGHITSRQTADWREKKQQWSMVIR